MNKLVKKEQQAMHKHFVAWPLIIVIVGATLLILGLIFLVYRSFNPKRDPQDMSHPVQQFEDKQEDKYGL